MEPRPAYFSLRALVVLFFFALFLCLCLMELVQPFPGELEPSSTDTYSQGRNSTAANRPSKGSKGGKGSNGTNGSKDSEIPRGKGESDANDDDDDDDDNDDGDTDQATAANQDPFLLRKEVPFSQYKFTMEEFATRFRWPTERIVNLAAKTSEGNYFWPKPWVAVCVAGTMRSFGYPAVHMSHRRDIIDPINGTSLGFFRLELRDLPRENTINCSNTEEDFSKSAQNMFADMPEHFASLIARNNRTIVPNNCATGYPYSGAAYHQLKIISDCYDLVLDYEARVGVKFDWILRVRPDILMSYPIPPLSQFNASVVSVPQIHSPISDHFGVVPRHLADVYFRAVDTHFVCLNISMKPVGYGHTEVQLMRQLTTHNVSFVRTPLLQIIIIRAYLGAECFRLGLDKKNEALCYEKYGKTLGPPASEKQKLQVSLQTSKLVHSGCTASSAKVRAMLQAWNVTVPLGW